MMNKAKSKTKMRRPKKPQFKRRTFMLDRDSEKDVVRIQRHTRHATASATMRHVVRRYRELLESVAEGGTLLLRREDGTMVELDLPLAS